MDQIRGNLCDRLSRSIFNLKSQLGRKTDISNLIEKIPIKTGNILTWILILFMIFNAGMSTLALNRYNQRQQGNLQKTPQMTAAVEDSRTDLEKFLDKHFPDKRMEQIYPNAKTVVDGKPVSQKDMKEKRKSS